MSDNYPSRITVATPETHRQAEKSWVQIGISGYIKIGIIAFLLYQVFHNEISNIVQRWLEDSSWSHGFLIPLFSLYFINQRKSDILSTEYKANYFGLVVLVFVIAFYFFNVLSPSGYGYFRPLSMIGALGATVLFLGGWGLVRYAWLPVGFLIFAVPLPSRYYFRITYPMRELAAKFAGVLLNIVNGLEASVHGVVIDVVYKGRQLEPSLDVAEACSGMRLLMAFLALGVAMAYLHYRPIWQRVILLLSTIPIAIICNIVRVTITGFIYILLAPKYAHGIYHDILGMLMLPLAFLLYGGLAWFISSLFVEESEQVKPDIIIHRNEGI